MAATIKKEPRKLQVLSNQALEDEFFEDVTLIAIVSAYEYCKLISYINQRLRYGFEKKHELEIRHKDNYYPVFSSFDECKLTEHYIFCNRQKNHFMMPEAKNIDYFWLIKGNILYQDAVRRLPEYLKRVEGVDFCFALNPNELKMRQLLII